MATAFQLIDRVAYLKRYLMSGKSLLAAASLIAFLTACGAAKTNLEPARTSVPIRLPPTWTPSLAASAVPASTEIPASTYTPVPGFTGISELTFTPVPVLTQPAYPTNDSIGQMLEQFEEALSSPDGQWVAYRERRKIRVVNEETTRVWTLPCELFVECSVLLPVIWSRGSQFLYFAPAPLRNGAPSGISIFTAVARIEVRSGTWELVLPDSDRYYDFTISPDYDYMAYTQSIGFLPGKPSVVMGVLRLKSGRVEEQFTLAGSFAGNIVWSPYKHRFIFQTQDPQKGSSIVYFDMESGVLKYILRDEPYDLHVSVWGEDNVALLRKTAWLNHAKTDWLLNPFTGEITSP